MKWNPGFTVYIIFRAFARNGVVNDTMDLFAYCHTHESRYRCKWFLLSITPWRMRALAVN